MATPRRPRPGDEAAEVEWVDSDVAPTNRLTKLESNLSEWWLETARADAETVVPKAINYGARDLLVLGASLAPELSDSARIEAGIAFYASGKCARILSALTEGRSASEDSWTDLSIYSFMGRYAREHGRWP